MSPVRAPLFLALSLLAAALGCGGTAEHRASAVAGTPGPRVAASHGEAGALARALAERLTVWTKRDGTRVYAKHCRNGPVDCEARIVAFAELIIEAAEAEGLDPYLLAAIALRESNLDPAAIGARGEAGIVQLHPRGAGRDVRYVHDPSLRERCQQQLDACQRPVVERGAQMLAESIEKCGSLEDGLARYASGRCGRARSYAGHVLDERDRLAPR